MENLETLHIDGDASVGRNVAVGGRATVQGDVVIKHNLKVEGDLDAPNRKDANKGVYDTVEALLLEYPKPVNGWYGLVGEDLYAGKNGAWVLVQEGMEIATDGTLVWSGVKGPKGETGPEGPEGPQGKSAYQVWLEEGNEGTEADFLNSLKAHVSRFIPIATESGATSLDVGDTYAFSDVSNPTDGAMLLMPNGDTTTPKTLMFSVTSNGDTPETFTYTYVGELSISTEGFLSSDKIVQNLTTGGADKVPSAAAVKGLNEKLYGTVDDNSVLTLAFEKARYGGFQNVSAETGDAWKYSTSGTYQPRCGLCIFEAAKLAGYKKIRVTMPLFVNGENGQGWLTFIKRADLPTASKTYAELVAGGYISEVHTAYNNMYISCGINSGYMQVTELDIPDDAIGACFTYRISASDPETRRKPNGVGVFGAAEGGDIPMLKKEVSEQSVVAGNRMTLTAAYNGYIRIPGGLWVENSNVKHAYVDVSELRGKSIVVENNENVATNVAFMTAIDTVEDYGEPSYADGFGVKEVADRVLGASSVFKVPDNANYLYVYVGMTERNATPQVYEGKSVKEIVTEGGADDEAVVFVPQWPLINLNHVGDSSGTVIADTGSTKYMMGIQPVKAGDRLRLTAKCTDTNTVVVPLVYGFHPTYPYVGQVISDFAKIQGVNGVTEVREVTAEEDGFFCFSCKRYTATPTYAITLDKVVERVERERIVAVGERVLHFLPAETSGAISESADAIHAKYDELCDPERGHPECFEKLTNILADNGEGEEVRLYRLGYKNLGGLYTGYMFEDPTKNGYYADSNEGGKSHDRLHVLFDAGVHGDEKSAVWGLYLFCKAVCEGTDAWAEYVRSNFVIDIIPIVCTKSYDYNVNGVNGSRDYPGTTGSETFTNPNRNFAERTILPIDAVAGYIDAHHDEYVLHVDCHNQSNNNAGGKCFVSALRNGLWFDEILQFQKKYAGVCKQNWDLLTNWTKPVNVAGEDEPPIYPPVADPKIVMQTNVETALGLNNSSGTIVTKYTQAFPCYTRSYGIVSLTMEAPRRLDNTPTNKGVCNKNAGKLTADLLCELLYIV